MNLRWKLLVLIVAACGLSIALAAILTVPTAAQDAAAIHAPTHHLRVAKIGAGGGIVQDFAGGAPPSPSSGNKASNLGNTIIDCGLTCQADITAGAAINLRATADQHSTFTGWNGPCQGSGDCALTMDADKVVTATFGLAPHLLSVNASGSGAGTVVSTPVGIACGGQCSSRFADTQPVTLSVVAASGSGFGGWSGACSGHRACVLTLDADKSVTAQFTQHPQPAIAISGTAVAGSIVNFTAELGMNDYDACTWRFGDGATVPCTAPIAASGAGEAGVLTVTAVHTYTNAGYYTVGITATNAAGQVLPLLQLPVVPATGTEAAQLFLPYLRSPGAAR